MGQTSARPDDELRSVSEAYVALSEDKRREFRVQVRAAGIDPTQLPISPFPDRTSKSPLSHAQERLWFLWQLDPASAAYNISGAVKLAGQFDVSALRDALDQICLKHESLRKRFVEEDGLAWQRVGDVEYGWVEHDMSTEMPETRERELGSRLVALSREPFDLRQGPVLRVALFRLGPDEHVLHFCIHHIVSDGWSMSLLNKAFVQAYAAALHRRGQAVSLEAQPSVTPLQIQYGDYARWQREWLDEGFLTQQLEYWTGRLGHEHPVLELPYTRRRTGLRSAEGGGVATTLDPRAAARLKQIARNNDTTLFVVLLAAYMVLLARYSGQQDIRVGIPVSGRDRLETEPIIGFFVNTLVIRGEFQGLVRFEDFLMQVRSRVLEAHANQNLPFAQLVEALQPPRSFGHTPLFQTMFNYGVADRGELALPGLTVSNLDIDLDSSRFDLVLQAFDASVLSLGFNYSTDVFDRPVVQRLLDHYAELLEQVAGAEGKLALGEIQLTSLDANHAERAHHPFEAVADRIGRRALAQPEAPAVHCEGERLSYGELDAWANRIAHRLRRQGVGREQRVGLCVRRSAALPAALLGILKAGAAFVPLDPDYPADRLAYMMADAGITHAVGDDQALSCVAELALPCSFTMVSDVGAELAEAPEIPVLPDQLAYVIYTSGSTGLPKGVAISQRALSLHLDDFIATYGIAATDKQFQSSTINFDVALHEMLPALIQGGQVEMRGGRLWSLEETSRSLAQAQVTFARIPTAYWQQWLRDPPEASTLSALRQITVGGEGLPGDALQRWQRGTLAHVRLDNLYGPTETTVACLYRQTTVADAQQAIVCIGHPYPSRSAYVLDGDANEVPTGGLGELCVGGETLARGYLDRPGLTAEKFIPDPFREDGGRLYRTGDLSRRREDGEIDFLGRMDQQVKLRGFRIELGEIEAVLRDIPGVREAVVELRGESDGRRLVAYVVGDAQDAILHDVAEARLPAYMVPSAYVRLERLPLLPSGKVDRKVLPEPDAIRQQESVAPRSPREAVLLSIWQDVLRLEDIGVTDNFFELGGDSILSLQIVARARQAGIGLTPRQVFEHSTVAGLARVAREVQELVRHEEIHEVQALTPIQQAFFTRFPLGLSHWNQSVLLAIPDGLEIAALARTIEALLAAHDALRLRFVRDSEGHWHQRVARVEAGQVLEVSDLRGEADWQAALEREGTRLQASLDIEQGPLMRAGYFILEGEARLLLAIHHLAVDGVSWRILFEELQQGYGQASEGQAVQLAPNTPWSVWVQRQLAHGQSEVVRAEVKWWRESLAGAEARLPVDGLAQAGPTHSVVMALDETETRQLLREAPRAYRAGVEDVLLAALAQTLGDWAGTDGVLVALEGHGREALGEEDLDLGHTVGWFTTQYPVWLPSQDDAHRAIVSTKERMRSVPNRGLHFGLLQSQLADLPQPQVGFNYLGQFDQSLSETGRFRFAAESGGESMAQGLASDMLLDLNGMIAGGRLSVRWDYRWGELTHAKASQLSQAFLRRLRVLIHHCSDSPVSATASDFPLAGLTQPMLESLALDLTEIEDLYPATPVQQGMLFHSLFNTGEGVYVNQKRLTLRGRLDRHALRRAWEAVCARHAVLRTHFVLIPGGQTLQVVHRHTLLPYEELDWSAQSSAEYEFKLNGWLKQDIARGFDLGRAPLMRLTLFLRPDGGHDLVWTDHHALLDGWSVSQVMGEVLQTYSGQGLTDPAVAYRDYVQWLALRARTHSETYWRGRLAHLDGATLLANAVVRPKKPAAVGSRVHELSDVLSVQLTEFSRREHVTLNTIIQAAWAVVLWRYIGSDTVAFGTTVSGRPAEVTGIERTVGLFINTVPLIVDVRSDERVLEYVQRIQSLSVEVREHEHTPLYDIQRWAGSNRELFDSLVVYENYPVSEVLQQAAPDDLTFEALRTREETNYALTLLVVASGKVTLSANYQARMFADETVVTLLTRLEGVLSWISQSPDRLLGEVPLLDEAQYQQLLALGRGTARYANRESVHDQIEAQAERTPQAIALICGDEQLSYAQLNIRANRLAHRLMKLGVGPEVKVGVSLERSTELVIALLAVLKAGGAYVPLDPSYPSERLGYMVQDSGLSLVLTQATLEETLWAELALPEGVTTLVVDALDLTQEPETNPGVSVQGENLAYVIYTSGSTGRPKGAGNRHSALSNRLAWMQQAYGLDDTDTVLQKTPFSFDVSVWEFFWPLMVGARLAMAEPGAHRDPAALVDLIERHQVTTLHFVPSMLQAFVGYEGSARCTGLKRIVCSGEALPSSLQDRVLEQWPEAGLYNLYGPTEAAIDVTHWTCRAGDEGVPIGRPIGNVQTYVLDKDLNLLAQGVAGELYLGGAGLGRGYEQRLSLTAERFVPDPFSETGGRLYRTGDLARWNGEGQLEYLGRIDHQVKIRGFRIELGEVESQLQAQAGVREAIVTAQEGPSGARLVGYVTSERDAELNTFYPLDSQQLRAQLGEVLPEYMVPSAIVVLEALPLTPNGKVDRKALPAPEFVSQGYEAAEGKVEQTLARIWQAVLGLERVGRQDNFFELGGDSILSLQIVARARQAGIGLTPRQVFEHSTVAGLARVAREVQELVRHEEIHEVQALTPIQQAFFTRFPLGLSHWNQSVLLAIPDGLEIAALARTIEALLAAHDALRLRFVRDSEGHWHQRVARVEAGQVLEVSDLRGEADWQAALEREGTRLQASLDIEQGPLMRAGYFILEGEARLLLAIHHLAVDGVSWRILFEELQQGYGQASEGQAVQLAPNTPWSVWVQRQLAHGQSEVVRAEVKWWRESLAGAEARLPVDGLAQAGPTHSVVMALDETETRQLLREAPRAYRAGVEDVLLAALAQTLGDWAGTDGVLVALEGHGREALGEEDLDLGHTVGWFTTQYPVWLPSQDDAHRAIVSTKERMRSVPNRGLHFGLLQSQLADLPQPQVGFNYLGQFDQSLSETGRFRFAAESGGESMAQGLASDMLLDLNGMIAGGRLSVRWSYRDGALTEARVRGLSQGFLQRIRVLITHCHAAQPTATASDFPLANVTQAELERLNLDWSDIEDIYPATSIQQGMLFHSLLKTGEGVYVNQKRLTLRGRLDQHALRQAWEAALARHAVLRTHFELDYGGQALQVVHRSVALPYAEHDWSVLSEADYETRLQTWRQDDISGGFDMHRAPLFRLVLFRRPDGEHDLVWTDHHVVMDGWSAGQLMGEVMHAYGASVNHTATVLPHETRYRDYIAWLQKQTDAQPWWRDVASRYEDAATLLYSLGNLKTHGMGIGEIREHLDLSSSASLRAAAQKHQVTLNTLVQAAWAALLSRYGNRRNVAFGITVSGRPAELAGAQHMLGLFINTMPIWFEVPGAAPIGAWLGALQDYNSQLRQYEHASLSDVQQWLGRSADALFDSLLVFESYPVDEKIRDGKYEVDITGVQAVERTHYPLAIAVVPGESVSIKWKWDRSRIPDGTATRLLTEFKSVLGQLGRPDIEHVGDLHVTLSAQHEPLCLLPFRPVASRIAERAHRADHRCALSCDGESLSYALLEARSNQIAQRLRRLGAGTNDRVGICMVRAPRLVAALLGVMKSGAAFVPLDPDYPGQRLHDMMDDAGIRWIVTDGITHDRHAELMTGKSVVLAEDVASEPSVPCDVIIHPDQLAYVIYTSGSTGKPKGVAISQRALSHHMDDFLATYRITEADRQLQSSTINFDVALHEMLPALIQGGQVVMRGSQPWELETMNRRLIDEGVTFARIPTAYWQRWLREPPDPAQLRLRQITVGGEALPGDALRQWRSGPLSHIRLDNLYGPTETTVACMYRQTQASDTEHVAAPIGKPYPSRSVYVLDLDGIETPIDGLGELCIGGATLAQAYLGRPGLTAERFVPDPFTETGQRLYRTGDLCRRLEDGTIAFLGRIDQQVKLRGFRIELGEIEMALRAVPGVRDAAAELHGDGDDKHLVGYIVGQAEAASARAALAATLPSYMVPSVFVTLSALPVLPSGKIDRKALPDAEHADTERRAAGPRTQMEAKLLSIWREVLRREDIGVFDDFFDLGGDSLKALTVASLANRHRIAEFSLESLFSHSTVASLGQHLDAKSPDVPSNIFPLNVHSGHYNVFAVHPGYGLVAEYRALARHVEGVANVYGIQSPLYTEPQWWPQTLIEMARDYVARLRRVQPVGPYRLIGWSSGGWLAREMAVVLESEGERVAFVGMVDASPRDEQAMDEIRAARVEMPVSDPREVSGEDVEALLRTMRDDAGRWQHIVPGGDAGLSILRTSLQVMQHFSAVELTGHSRGPYAPLFLWRARDGAVLSSKDSVRRWREVSEGSLVLVKEVETDHVRIIQNPAFLDSVLNTFISLQDDPDA